MLSNQPWIKFADCLYLEWQQCMYEGLDVSSYESLCSSFNQLNGNSEHIAMCISEEMHKMPMQKDFPFYEPSQLDEIKKARPSKSNYISEKPLPDQLKNKISGAWIGRITGCLLGKPVEGFKWGPLNELLKKTDNYPMHKYVKKIDFTPELISGLNINIDNCWADNLKGAAPIDDDTNYTVFTMKLIEKFGKDFKPDDVLESWLEWIPMLWTCTAERVAYRNAASCMLPPQTAVFKNPYREWIGAQIRGDFFGYINPGNPELAAEMACRDASVSHVKNGIYGEMYIAAMIAQAAVCDDIMQIINAGLNEIPENSRLRNDVDKVINWYEHSLSAEEIIENIHKVYDDMSGHGWCYTIPNAMIVTMALLCGEKDFGKSICLAVQAAFDTDCNGATVGSIIGMLVGRDKIDQYWLEPYNGKLFTSIIGYTDVNIDQLTEKTLKLI